MIMFELLLYIRKTRRIQTELKNMYLYKYRSICIAMRFRRDGQRSPARKSEENSGSSSAYIDVRMRSCSRAIILRVRDRLVVSEMNLLKSSST
jgi:hypothetical protein